MAKKVTVKKDVCIGCGLCTSTAPEVFAFGDDGLAEAVRFARCRLSATHQFWQHRLSS